MKPIRPGSFEALILGRAAHRGRKSERVKLDDVVANVPKDDHVERQFGVTAGTREDLENQAFPWLRRLRKFRRFG